MAQAGSEPSQCQAANGSRRRFPWRLSRHLAGQYGWPLLGTIAGFAMVSLLLAVFDDLPDFSGKGVPAGAMMLYFAAGMPRTLLTILPFSSLLAICFMTMIMGKNNELTAMRSAGVSLLTASLPVFGIALVLCALSFVMSESVEPAARGYHDYIKERYLERKKDGGAQSKEVLAYYNARYRRDWFFSGFSRQEPCQGVVVRCLSAQGRTLRVISAAWAVYLPEARSWSFRQGEVQEFGYLEDGTPVPGDRKPFAEQVFEFHEKPRDIFLQSQSCEELPLSGLWRVNTRSDAISARSARLVKAMIAWRLSSPFSALIATLLGFSLTLSTGRKTAIRGFVLAVALFMIYHLLAQFALVLGKNGIVNPFLSGCIPTALALAASFIMAYRRQ